MNMQSTKTYYANKMLFWTQLFTINCLLANSSANTIAEYLPLKLNVYRNPVIDISFICWKTMISVILFLCICNLVVVF